MYGVQEICDRTALATGKGLGELITKRFRGWQRGIVAVLLLGLLGANALNISADLVAIGSGMNLLHAGPTALWAAIAGVSITVLVMAGSFATVAKVFKVLCATLLSYIGVLFVVHVPWRVALEHLVVPHIQFTKAYLALVVAILGTTISPYLFFWQSAHRIEDLRAEPEGGNRPVAISELPDAREDRKERTSRLDVFTGMGLSQLVMFAVIVSTAVTLHAHGQTEITSAAQAAEALKPIAGSASSALFALGFIGAGMLAVPVLAGSGSAGIAGLLGKSWGYSRSPRKAPVFYGLVLLGTIGGTALTLLHVNPISLLVIVAVINGLAAAPFLIVIMIIASNNKIMGDHHNGPAAKVIGWLTVAIMATAAVTMVATGGL
jgi:Mn2+/Fe2+ NRAMP family transporter